MYNQTTENLGSDGVPINLSDGAQLDAFARQRISNPVSKFANKNIHNRNKSQWEEPIVGALIVYSGIAGGPFQVAEIITGGTSGTMGTITAINGGTLTITYTVNHDDFVVGETITGGTSGATATVDTVGTGSTITHSRDEAAVILQVGALSGDQAVRQSHRYIPYIPGDSQLIGETFIFGAATTNRRKRVGYFSPDNGIYLEQTIGGLRITRRTKTSGSIVNNEIEQSSWNQDTFDGNGPSKINLDFTKEQFLVIDFQWQGAGRIRFGFFINGRIIDAHHINTSNTLSVPWMSTPSLPVRYEITNTGAATGTDTMKEVCTSVISEGGEKLTGLGFSVSNDIVTRTSTTTKTPILAIRLKNTFGTGGGENRKTVRFSNASVYATSQDIHFEIAHIHDPTGITATWTDRGGGSAVEYSTDISAITGNPEHDIEEGYVAAGQAGKGTGENAIGGEELDQHRFLTQNIDSTNSEIFVIFSTAFTGTANNYSHISWIEFE